MRTGRICAAVGAAAVMAALMCGCEGGLGGLPLSAGKTPELDKGWSAQADITFGESSAKADVTRSEQGCWEFAFTEPPELCGVVMTLENGSVSASLGELNVTAGEGGYTMLPLLIADGIDAVSGADKSAMSEKDGVLTIRTEADGSSCTVTADSATGGILSFRSPGNKLAAYFSEASPYTEDVGVIE